jgi:hypothetical protein
MRFPGTDVLARGFLGTACRYARRGRERVTS